MILIVDDDPALAENCSLLLEAYGYEVGVACSGDDALEKMARVHLDLLISDCTMDGMTGLELSRKVRTAPASCGTPILLMSGSMQCDVARGNTYDGFIRKPFLAEELVAQVRRLMPATAAAGVPARL